MSTPDDLPVQRFYLRKIEGADVLLADETNFLRQELHKWAPVAPNPPPNVNVSMSTRKPRPTKQQKLMAQLGITDPQELPPQFRPKLPGTKKKERMSEGRKDSESGVSGTETGPALTSHTPPGSPGSRAKLPAALHGVPMFTASLGHPGVSAAGGRPGPQAFVFEPIRSPERPRAYSPIGVPVSPGHAPRYSPIFEPPNSLPAWTMVQHGTSRPAKASPQHTGIITDPTLDNMFGRPSGSNSPKHHFHDENDGAGFNLASPKQAGLNERSDAMDLFGSLTNDAEHDVGPEVGGRSPFGVGFEEVVDGGEGVGGVNAFEEGLGF